MDVRQRKESVLHDGVMNREVGAVKHNRSGSSRDANFNERPLSVGVHAKQRLVFRVLDSVLHRDTLGGGHELPVLP